MVQIPTSLFFLFLTGFGIVAYLWIVSLISDWLETRNRIAQEAVEQEYLRRYGGMMAELRGHQERILKLEEENNFLRDEVCTLTTRNIQICNELRSDETSSTQHWSPTNSARFSRPPPSR